MIKFSHFSLSSLEECLKEFIQIWIIRDQQVLIQRKIELFSLIYTQMISVNIEQDQFDAVFKLLMVYKDSKGAILLTKLDPRLYSSFKNYLKETFMASYSGRLSASILNTYIRLI